MKLLSRIKEYFKNKKGLSQDNQELIPILEKENNPDENKNRQHYYENWIYEKNPILCEFAERYSNIEKFRNKFSHKIDKELGIMNINSNRSIKEDLIKEIKDIAENINGFEKK